MKVLFIAFFGVICQVISSEASSCQTQTSCLGMVNLDCSQNLLARCPNVSLAKLSVALEANRRLFCTQKNTPECPDRSRDCTKWIIDEILLELVNALCGIIQEILQKLKKKSYVCTLVQIGIDYVHGIIACHGHAIKLKASVEEALDELDACYETTLDCTVGAVMKASEEDNNKSEGNDFASIIDRMQDISQASRADYKTLEVLEKYTRDASDSYQSDKFNECFKIIFDLFYQGLCRT